MVAALLGVSVVVVAGGDGEGRNQNGDGCRSVGVAAAIMKEE
jgi:hypothetical protein